MKQYAIDGVEIQYALDLIEKIDPDLVGHATLFTKHGNSIITGEIQGRIRELLIADYKRRPPESLPELLMYSGSRME
jgi:hypothetical protein